MARELLEWLTGSARFRAFAEAHRDKIRKKFRGATDAESLRDVRAELQTARLLLADRRIELAFEAYGSGKGGPDFTVTFRGARSFNLEVTRPHRVPDAGGLSGALLAKLRQLPPSTPERDPLRDRWRDGAEALDVDAAARALRSRADAKDEAFFTTRGFDGARGVLRALPAAERRVRRRPRAPAGTHEPRCGSTGRPGSPCPSQPPVPAWPAFEATR